MANYRWPAEWEPQDGVLLAWPHEGTDWADTLGAVEGSYTGLAAAISRRETAVICVCDDALESHARELLGDARAVLENVRFVRAEYDDTWLRDSGPVTLTDGEHFRLLDFLFTGWGGKFGAERDDRIVSQLFDAGLFRKAERARIDWALEGGGIEGDGGATVLSTMRCLGQRHPHLTRTELAEQLRLHLDVTQVHLLEHGYLQGDDTDAHIDTLARFADPGHIVYQGCDDAGDEHYAELGRMAEELAALRQVDGTPYRLTALPWAGRVQDDTGRRLAASYANFLIVNGAVLMPAYGGEARDAEAADALRGAFPAHEIVPLPCRSLIEQNGSLHCLTMQLPRGVLADPRV